MGVKRAFERIATLLLAVGISVSMAEGRASAAPREQVPRHALLDVPYVSQTPELCGGAAVAMVLRYWGARDVFPQDFASLVGQHDGGIRTDALASAVRDRGWQALVIPAPDASASARMRSEIDRGRPLIALIEVAPRTYHYVVIVGSTDEAVVLHDPARAPFRVTPWAEFDHAWAAAGRWMLLTLPLADIGANAAAATTASEPLNRTTTSATPCSGLVERAVGLALAGERDAAEQGLTAATRLCPSDPAPWRELAGLRFSESRWSEAEKLALTATRFAPDDEYAWQLIATSRYLGGDRRGALEAWNRVGEPRIDAIDIHGAERTPHPVVVRVLGLRPRELLSAAAFDRALRRLGDLPIAWSPRITYEPLSGGLAQVDAGIDERPVVPSGWIAFATLGARALVQREARVEAAGALGRGEVAGASWRWSAGRPRVRFDLAAPSPGGLPGVLSVDWSWERQSYQSVTPDGEPAVVRFTRRRAAFHLSDWQAGWARWQIGVALDRFGVRNTAALEATLDLRFARDRVALVTAGEWWVPLRGHGPFATSGLLVAWRSTDDRARPMWSATTEIRAASPRAPVDLWHGAGTGQGRSGLLRAHPLLSDGVFVGPVFGRVVANTSFEYARPVAQAMGGSLALAGFVDAARAWHRLNGLGRSALYLDVGIGLRARTPGRGGTIRVDVAHGLRGGGTTLSAGWGGTWPR